MLGVAESVPDGLVPDDDPGTVCSHLSSPHPAGLTEHHGQGLLSLSYLNVGAPQPRPRAELLAGTEDNLLDFPWQSNILLSCLLSSLSITFRAVGVLAKYDLEDDNYFNVIPGQGSCESPLWCP